MEIIMVERSWSKQRKRGKQSLPRRPKPGRREKEEQEERQVKPKTRVAGEAIQQRTAVGEIGRYARRAGEIVKVRATDPRARIEIIGVQINNCSSRRWITW